MKKLLSTAVLLLMCGVAMAQSGISSISYEDLEDWSRSKNGYYDAYTAKDGHTYRLEDKVVFGATSHGKTYVYMWEQLNVLHVLADTPPRPVSGKWAGRTGVIKEIHVRGTKKSGHDITVVLAVGGLNSRIAVRPFDLALECQEIISQGKTKELALKELKEAKDMLDLGLISQADFDAKKEQLKKYILGK